MLLEQSQPKPFDKLYKLSCAHIYSVHLLKHKHAKVYNPLASIEVHHERTAILELSPSRTI